jgi:hypothetical protein
MKVLYGTMVFSGDANRRCEMDSWVIVLIALLVGEIVGFVLARLGDRL